MTQLLEKTLENASALNINEQIALVEAVWDNIASLGKAPLLTEAQRAELDRRLADHQTHPEQVISWKAAKAAALDKIA